MKEIDIKTIQGLIDKQIEAINLKYIIIFIVLNLIIVLINWLLQRNIKNIDNAIYRKKVREDKRISVLEEIYKRLVAFSYCYSHEEIRGQLNELIDLEKFISENKLYITNRLHKKIIKYTDYTKNVIADFRKKNVKQEMALLNDIETEFNK